MKMSTTPSFQVGQLGLKRKDLIASDLQQEFHARHSRQLGSSTRRQAAELVQFDRRQHTQLAGEQALIGLLGKEYTLWNVNCDLACCHCCVPLREYRMDRARLPYSPVMPEVPMVSTILLWLKMNTPIGTAMMNRVTTDAAPTRAMPPPATCDRAYGSGFNCSE